MNASRIIALACALFSSYAFAESSACIGKVVVKPGAYGAINQEAFRSLQEAQRAGNQAAIKGLWAAAGFVDTNLSFLSFLELYRTDVAQRRMTPPGVVEALDVIEHIRPGLLSAAVDLPGNALRFH